MKYALFLRGINVGGIKVPMAELRTCLNELGLSDVKTFVQTGNVTFESEKSKQDLKPVIENALGERFHYEAFVLLYPAAILEDVIRKFPFPAQPDTHRYAIFCENQDVIDELVSFKKDLDPSLEDVAAGDHVVYWRVPIGSTLGTPFSKVIGKLKYKAVTTNRNLNTLEKML